MNLSQEEIEVFAQALDSKSSTKGKANKQVKGYDFSHPDKLSKNHFKVLQCVMSSLERSWSSSLSAVFRSEVTATVSSLEQVSFGAFAESLAGVAMLATLSLGKLSGVGYLHLPAEFALSAVDRMTGGRGKIHGGPRALSDVESMVIKRLIDAVANDFGAAWKPLTDVKVTTSRFFGSIDEIETDQSEALLVAGFVWNVSSTKYTATLAIPVNSLYSIRDVLTMEQWMSGKPADSQSEIDILSSPLLDAVMLDAAVELGKARVSMHDVMEIGVGDVIRLDSSVGDAIAIQIQGKVKFHGRPGLAGNQIAVQITDLADETDQPAQQNEIISEPVFGG